MSHRDEDRRTGSRTSAQELVAVADGLFSDRDWDGVRFRKDCEWAARGLVIAALVWAWSSKHALKDRFAQVLPLTRGLGRSVAPVRTSYQAFLKLLVRWTPELRHRLVAAFRRLMECRFPDQFRVAGYTVLAGDGSKLQLARTRSNEACYSPAKARRRRSRCGGKRAGGRPACLTARRQRGKDKKGDSPQMALTLLYHVTLRLPWDWRLGPYDASERDHLRAMIPQLPADALVTADCGFVGYDFWSDLLQSGREFVIRVGGNVRLLKKLGIVRESHGTVYLWPAKTAKRRVPPLVLRLVTVHDGRQPWFLVTSVRNAKRLSDRQVGEIYRRRWRIELFFRHFKQTCGRAKLRSHKAQHAEVEAEWSLLGLWAMLLHTQTQQPTEQARPRCLSVARMRRAFGKAIDEHRCRPAPGESLEEQLLSAVIDGYGRRDRTSRGYPRKKYESQAKPPQVLKATRAQCKLAQQLPSRDAEKGLPA